MTLDDILKEINNVQTIVILSHENPDGDAIGSSLAMCLALKNMGKDVDVLMNEYPANFSFLPGIENLKFETEIENYDMAIVLDCPEIKRVPSNLIPYFENAKIKVEFDHHNKNDMFADYNVVSHVAPAAAQILVSSFQYLGIEITKEIGECLLTGVITDTNGFRNSNVTVDAFDYASWCLEKGIDLSKIYKQSMFADYNIVDHVAPACSQILVSSFEYLGINITKEIGTCLLTGIITDTGGFKNSGITTSTFDFASWALENGINLSKIYRESMLIMTKSKFEVQKLCMDRMEFFADGKIAFTYMTKEDDKTIGIQTGDHDGVVEIGRSIEGVEVSIFLYEKEKGFKASLRSNDYVNVSEVCLMFGGGGHIKAAGATINLPLEEAKKAIVSEVIKYLK